jgi:hypothetical protein
MATYQDSRYNIALPSGSGGALVLIKTLTASSSATLSFVDGASDVVLDNTYRTYIFKFYNIHPATDETQFQFNMSIDGGSNYNVTKTTTYFHAAHRESDTTEFFYRTPKDLAQSTSFQDLVQGTGADNDQCSVGSLHLFSPSSTTFVKHFIANISDYNANDFAKNNFIAGYGNTTSAVDAVRFQMASGNIDSGTIKLYGIA